MNLIQKQVNGNILSFAVGITLPVLMFRISLLKIKNFELLYFHKNLSYLKFSIIKITCCVVFYNICKYKKILSIFFLPFL